MNKNIVLAELNNKTVPGSMYYEAAVCYLKFQLMIGNFRRSFIFHKPI
jgi:hypothetical protein